MKLLYYKTGLLVALASVSFSCFGDCKIDLKPKDNSSKYIEAIECLNAEVQRINKLNKNLPASNSPVTPKVAQASVTDNNIMIQSGSLVTGHDESTWVLANTSTATPVERNRRSSTKYINFDHDFPETPSVVIGISYIDATPGGQGQTVNVRISAEAHDITKSGFNLKVSTWDGSKVWGAGINWIAYH